MSQTLPSKKVSTAPEQDNWLDRSPEDLAAVQRGLADSVAGRGVKRSFLKKLPRVETRS